ncbi:MAG TPA: bacteriocin-protection protein [Marinilabiliales bacterium]|nr:MAG: bacteriocin-protection protein [Bacteroidetes bacterium GWC2_40_13]OFX71993.1 MAG: bacteriocin-protection protein [Bacteroidetes bacterium GWD2_40_43]OFX89677.1 MAG: bacteriocin-protection protein [Bacteroidetes bacterium GWE2_40_63]OFY24117.1 MAG: bacteriocin-protection protein [Bacteroidetes bacterium GWF2_40_13]OFZ26309.1 MAG: bacteriocin-protection protein [Bacteroidetes bacterium RIFOXYC2_FULL_40_12]HAM99529.1 bacteriocin-protection protein [Marinilabiliales bacterium]
MQIHQGQPLFFENQEQFREWLSEHSRTEKELWVGYYKVESGMPSLTWPQSVDQALCFGWIDGIRRSIDKDRYCIRFTPRKPNSNWSLVNIEKAESLILKGLMTPDGMVLFQNRKVADDKSYSYENKPEQLPQHLEQLFRKNTKAWEFFSNQSKSYQRTVLYWILSAKQEATKTSRLMKTIDQSLLQKRIM